MRLIWRAARGLAVSFALLGDRRTADAPNPGARAITRRPEARRGRHRVPLDEDIGASAVRDFNILELDRALDGLAAIDPRKTRVIEMRFVGEMTVEETAEALHVSADTVKSDWRLAKLWLVRELEGRGCDR